MIKNKSLNTIGLTAEKKENEYCYKTLRELKNELKLIVDEKKREQIEKKIEERKKILHIGESCTDDSHFIPMSELVKRGANPLAQGNDPINGQYDFVDGKDNGMKIPMSRNQRNIAELSRETRELKKEFKNEASKLDKKINDAKEVLK